MKFKQPFIFVTLLSLIAFIVQLATAGDARGTGAANPKPNDLVFVEVGFSEQITPEHLEIFEKHGGIVDYVFQTIAFGWVGRLPRNQMQVMPNILGSTFVFIEEGQSVQIPTLPTWQGDIIGFN